MPFYLQFPPVGGQVLGFPSGAAKLTGAKAASISAASRIRRAFFTVELLCGGLGFNRGNVGWIGVFADANAGSSGFLKLERGK